MSFSWNPADKHAEITLSGGDLYAVNPSATGASAWRSARGSALSTTRNSYLEFAITGVNPGPNLFMGIVDNTADLTTHIGNVTGGTGGHGYAYYQASGDKFFANVASPLMSASDIGDVVMVAFNPTTRKLWFGLNGVFVGNPAVGTGEAFTVTAGYIYYPGMSDLGQKDDPLFLKALTTNQTYAAPSGFTPAGDGDIVQLSGTASFAFNTAGTLTAKAALVGAASIAFSTAGTLTAAGSGALSGNTSFAFSTQGTLRGAAALSGSANLAFNTQAVLRATAALSGNANFAFATTGLLTAVGPPPGPAAFVDSRAMPVLLVDLGAGPLPVVTPPSTVYASWVPAVYVPPQVPAPGAFTATPVVDAVLLTWTAVNAPSPQYAIERASDVAGAPGAWVTIARTTDLRYSVAVAVADGVIYWWRVKALVFGRASAYTAALQAAPISGDSLSDDAADALAAANAAQAAANAANADLANIASDSLLTPDEKPRVIQDRDVIVAEQSGIDAQATAYGIATEKTAYDNAVVALTNYLATLTAPVLWSNLAGNTAIVGATFRGKFADVYTTRQSLLNKIYETAKANAATAQAAANAAQTAANTAQAAANAANADLANIASDSLLTPDEKPRVIQDRDVIVAEQAGIDAQAAAYTITTEKTAYDNAVAALTAYMATLTAPVLWSNLSSITAIDGATFRNKFADVYTTRQALLNKIYENAKAIAEARIRTFAQEGQPSGGIYIVGDQWFQLSTKITRYWTGAAWALLADTAETGGDALLLNADMEAGDLHWNKEAQWYWEDGATYGKSMVRAGSGAAPSSAVVNNKRFSVAAGQVLKVSGQIAGAGGANGVCLAACYFYDAANNFHSLLGGNQVIGDGGLRRSSGTVIVPAGAAKCSACFYASGQTAGYYIADSARISVVQDSLDEMIDGDVYGRYANDDRVYYNGRYRMGMRVPGSNHRPGDLRNQHQLTIGGLTAKVQAAISYSASAGAPATATISVAGFTMLIGSLSIGYDASSVGVTGTSGTTTTFFLYMDDPGYNGGSPGLGVTTYGPDLYTNNGRFFVGSVAVVFPAAGSGSGGGDPEGGGPRCVTLEMLLRPNVSAACARAGLILDCLNLPTGPNGFQRAIESVDFADAECVRLTTERGAELDCSTSTPFDVLDGRTVLAPDMQGECVVTDQGIEQVVEVRALGRVPVAHIHVGGISYAAGRNPQHRIFSHNLKP